MQTCKYCGNELIKRENEHQLLFSKRKYCSVKCKGLDTIKKRISKYDKYIKAGILKDLESMNFNQVSEKHKIQVWEVKNICECYNINKRKLNAEFIIKRNREIAQKVRAGVPRQELKKQYGLSDYMIKVIGGASPRKKEFELNGIETGKLGTVLDFEINVKPKLNKYSFYATNGIWK